MEVLRKNDLYYTDDEIEKFQFKINSFANIAVSIYSKRILTNYIYDIVSGYISAYMKELGCLYRYSQQGWEALNSLVKIIF